MVDRLLDCIAIVASIVGDVPNCEALMLLNKTLFSRFSTCLGPVFRLYDIAILLRCWFGGYKLTSECQGLPAPDTALHMSHHEIVRAGHLPPRGSIPRTSCKFLLVRPVKERPGRKTRTAANACGAFMQMIKRASTRICVKKENFLSVPTSQTVRRLSTIQCNVMDSRYMLRKTKKGPVCACTRRRLLARGSAPFP